MDNQPLERTAAAVYSLKVERRVCAAAAAQRLYVMRRRLSQILTALLLLVGLMVGALWVRSYWRFDKVERWNMNHDTGFSVWSASSNYGLLTLSFTDNRGWIRSHRKIPDGVHWWFTTGTSGLGDSPPGSLGFGLWREHDVSDVDRPRLRVEYAAQNVRVPHWFPTMLLLALPVRWAWLHRRARRWSADGRCRRCGYDLRHTPDRCPECGTGRRGEPAAA